jgi:ABC-type multidrug transport system fused ATPase/permease subunit
MYKLDTIKNLIRRYKWKLAFTYGLFSLEMLGSLLRPFFLGLAVNDLIAGSYKGLITLSLVHLAWLIIGTLRHMYDTRTYSAIYSSMVIRFLSKRRADTDVSKLSAHSTLSRELVDFMESDLPYVIEAFYNIVGSIILLMFYDHKVVFICLSILLPVVIISHFYGKKLQVLNRMKNDELEKQVSVIAMGNEKSIHRHYQKLRHWQIKISDREAINFGIMEIMVLFVIGGSLLVSTGLFGTTILAGHMIGIYNYILKFVSGLDTIPYTVQRLSSLNDIARRIELHQSEMNRPQNEKEIKSPLYRQGELKLTA